MLTTKVGMWDQRQGLSAANIRQALDDSLRRLATDYVDLYFAHVDDPMTPLEESLAALDRAVTEGKVRHIGASNYSSERLSAALAVSAAEGLARFVAVQTPYNLMTRGPYESEIAPCAAREGLAVLPYYGLAQGFLTGRYRSHEGDHSGPRAAAALKYLDDRGLAVLETLDQIALAHSVAPAAIALAWLLSRPEIAAPVASARTPAQLEELMPSIDVRLTDLEISALDNASATTQRPLSQPARG